MENWTDFPNYNKLKSFKEPRDKIKLGLEDS